MSCNGARFEPLYELRPANQALVDRHQGDRYKKKFLYWDHLLVMLYAQIAGVSSLRSVETGFNPHRNHHDHLHTRQVRRTTLADANERRDPILFEELTRALMAQAGNAIRKERRELLYLIDSTTIGLHSPAAEIARLYKQRWTIELFFKWIKQHLKIKTFLGESENAVRIQLLTALIAYLLVVIHKAAGALKDSLWEILTELRTGLFLRVQQEQERWRRRRQRQAIIDAVQRRLFT